MNIFKSVAKAIQDFDLIDKDDRILIGASGGKDSLALSYILSNMRYWKNRPFSLGAIYIHNNVTPYNTKLESLYSSWDIPLTILSQPQETSDFSSLDCYTCATQRRVAIMHYAVEHGYNKIALGHHLDDTLTTLLMNLVLQGKIDVLEPKRYYEPFKVTLIRPLFYTPEESIIRFVRSQTWHTQTCTCLRGTKGVRSEYRRRLESLAGGSLQEKMHLLTAFISRKQ